MNPVSKWTAFFAMSFIASLTSSATTPAVRRVAFVFDDGPVVEQTQQMLAVLAHANVHVTFSYVGKNVIEHPELARAAAEAGHDIANHSFTHPHLKTLSEEVILKELTDTNAAISKATGRTLQWFWAPFLEMDDRVESAAHSAHLTPFPYQHFHFVSTEDWNVAATDAAMIRQRATTDIRDNTVVLCHEWRPETLAQLPAILEQLKSEGVVFLTFTEMAALDR